MPVTVHQHDGVVHGEHQLQDCADGQRDIRSAAKNIVGSGIDDHGHADRGQKKKGLHPGRTHGQKNDQDDQNGQGNDPQRHVAAHGVVLGPYHFVNAPVLLFDFTDDAVELRGAVSVRTAQNIKGISVLFIGGVSGGKGNGIHIRDGRETIPDLRLFFFRHVMEHDPDRIRHGERRKLFRHDVDAFFHCGIRGEITGHICDHRSFQRQKATENSCQEHDHKCSPPVTDQCCGEFCHKEPPGRWTISMN